MYLVPYEFSKWFFAVPVLSAQLVLISFMLDIKIVIEKTLPIVCGRPNIAGQQCFQTVGLLYTM
jgi:hypothetical protein